MAVDADNSEPGATNTPAADPVTGTRWTTAGAVLLTAAAIFHIVYGAAAIGGDAALEHNIREIESSPHFGSLYLGLTWWGVILAVVGLCELFAARALARRATQARLIGLAAALFGLAVAFFTLAIFHAAAFAPLGLLLAVLYVLSYRVAS